MESTPLNCFEIKDCTLAVIATGIKAQTLLDFRDRLLTIRPSCTYFHFWGGRLSTSFEYREFRNDFSHWAHQSLHDDILAERLELLDPCEYNTMEDLNNEIIEIVNDRIDEIEWIPWAKSDEQFHFMESKIIVFQTRHKLTKPEELVTVIPKMTHSSLFYHFIDSVRRTPEKIDDFSLWLKQSPEQYKDLIEALRHIDPYYISLSDLQNKLTELMRKHLTISESQT